MVTQPTMLLEGSACQHPHSGEFWRHQREKVVEQAVAMGFEYPTMVEYPLSWADDQDPFNHVAVSSYMHMISRCGQRIFESFQGALKDQFEDLMHAKTIGIVTKSFNVKLKRSLTYPDLVIAAAHVTDVRRDRIVTKYALWSAKTGEITAEAALQMVFVDHRQGRPADLVSNGGVYADLHADLVKRASKSDQLVLEWTEKQKL